MRVSKRVRQWLMVLSATLLVAGTLSGVPIVNSVFDVSSARADEGLTEAPDDAVLLSDLEDGEDSSGDAESGGFEADSTGSESGTSGSGGAITPMSGDIVPFADELALASAGAFSLEFINMTPEESVQELNPLAPGDTFTYTVGVSCNNAVESDPCEGAELELSNFLFGDSIPLIWGGGPNLVGGGTVPFTASQGGASNGAWTFTATNQFLPGDPVIFTFDLKVPANGVPLSPTELSPNAKVTLDSASNTTDEVPHPWIESEGNDSTISKTSNASNGRVILYGDSSKDVAVKYTVNMRPATGHTLANSYVITDTLPSGATVVSGSISDGGSLSGSEIKWNIDFTSETHPTVKSDGSFDLTYSVKYSADAGVNETGHAKGSEDEALTYKKNTVTGTYGPGDEGVLPETTHEIRLVEPPVTTSVKKTSGGEYYVAAGNQITYTLTYENTSDDVTDPLTDAVMIDGPLPAQFVLQAINTTAPTSGVTVSTSTAAGSAAPTNPSEWTEYTGGAVPSGVRWVKWEVTELAPDAQIKATLTGGIAAVSEGVDAGEFCNAVNSSAYSPDRAANITSGATRCLYLDDAITPHPYITKSAPNPSIDPEGEPFKTKELLPGGSIDYVINLQNNADATGPLVNPTIFDCVPNNEYLTVSDLAQSGGNGFWKFETLDLSSTDCEDGTLIKASLQTSETDDAPLSLEPGQAAPTVTYTVSARPWIDEETLATPAGPYTNTVKVKASDDNITHCATGTGVGAGDYIGEGDPAECSASETITVPAVAFLRSEKFVKGALDSAWNKAGTTSPGGQMTWQLRVRNIGNSPAGDVTIVDILPHIGDTGVRRVDQPRNSEFRPLLVEQIPAQANWTIEYSLSDDPQRMADLALSAEPGSQSPNWTSTPNQAQLSQYRSIRLSRNDVIEQGDEVTFEYNMVAPVEDASYTADGQDLSTCTVPLAGWPSSGGPGNTTLESGRQDGDPTCPVASNSFAFAVTAMLDGGAKGLRIGAEPPKVDVHVVQPMADTETQAGIGDRVWYDYDRDGIQNTDEPGVPGVRVELHLAPSDDSPVAACATPVAVTFTDENGLYLFTTKADGTPLQPDEKYVVRFYPPAGYEVSAQNQGTDSRVDSDVPHVPSGTATGCGLGDYHDTVPVTLPEGIDPTWDMGIWGGEEAAISIDKVTKDSDWDDDDAGDGVYIQEDRPITWIYTITNTGNARLKNVTLWDDHGTDGETGDDFDTSDFSCEIIENGENASGTPSVAVPESNSDEGIVLNRGAVMRCTITGVADSVDYANNSRVDGTPTLDNGGEPKDREGNPLSDVYNEDPSSYHSVGRFAVGDYMWVDLNHNGIQDEGEAPVPGATVELLNDSDNSVVASTTTNEDGLYLFSCVPSGDYKMRFTIPVGSGDEPTGFEGYIFTWQNLGDNAIDSDVDPNTGVTDTFTLSAGEGRDPNIREVTSADPGFYGALWGCGLIEVDDGDDIVLPAPNLINPTIDAGITPLDAGIKIDKVTKDSAWDDSAAGDGVEIVTGRDVTWLYTVTNQGLTRLKNVTLWDDHGTNGDTGDDFDTSDFVCEITRDGVNEAGLLSSVDPDGVEGIVLNRGAEMRCTITLPNGLAPGITYANNSSVVGTPTQDDGGEAGLPDVTDEDPSSYYSLPQRFAVGDYVWFDLNHNGVQDPSETGVPGVTVELLNPDGSVVDTTATNFEGLYLFCDVPAGDYKIRFSNIPGGYEFTNQNVGSNVGADSDADASGLTGSFTIDVNAENIRTVTSADADFYGDLWNCNETSSITLLNPTIDAGIWLPTPNVGITKQAEVNKVASGTTVMWTLKVRNTGTGSANGVVVVDTLPEGLEFQAGSTGPTPTYDSATREVSWVIPTVSPGETVTISYTTLVTAPGGTKLTNAVVIAGNDKDPEGSDDDTIEVEVEDEEETPPTTPTDPTTPTTDPNVDADNADRDRLPHTGSNISLFAALAATLTAVGAVMVGVSRRRRMA